MNKTFYHYVIFFFIPGSCPCSESSFSILIIATKVFFLLLVFAWPDFSHLSLSFALAVHLSLYSM